MICTGLAVYFICFAMTCHSSWSDENLYLYVAQRVSEGATLYGEIHSARPPLIIILPAALIRLGLTPFAAGRTLVGLSVLLTGYAVHRGARTTMGSNSAAMATTLFFTAPAVMSRFAYTGINLVTAMSAAAVVSALAGRPLLAGVCAALCLLSGQHGVVVVSPPTKESWRSCAATTRDYVGSPLAQRTASSRCSSG